MTGERQTRRPSGAAPSGASGLEDRVSELEGRVMRVESRRPSMDDARGWFGQVMPADAREHFRTAMRHQLLGMRAMVDHWIRRMDRDEPRPNDREQIRID